ncbi:hypothetical protein VA603_15910 [Stenotrophomonas sp. MH1]|uniref:HEPN AbiJ-N-terminal domain-containing protein n=1 Tax=Stenotrophomonas capsici TaxID=3110230 RepID=A0ABU5V6Q6_9GAMM|nr:hypothetical protein [Stenotrophomonas sp. MH1]MEA5669031.1 hypothetical protein [Stenotrophomonas sp. MH1]
MLTDIFAERYSIVPIWRGFGEAERRLLVQAFRIVSEQLFPYWTPEGKERDDAKATWKSMHDRLSMELGQQQLAPMGYWAQTKMAGNDHQYWVSSALVHVCNNFVCAAYDPNVPADRFIKERLSFVEIAFRDRENAVAKANAELPAKIAQAEAAQNLHSTLRIPGNRADGVRAANKTFNDAFRANVCELNERFRRAGTRLNYHNGFIQIAEDEAIEREIETPFWALVNDPKWANVDTDMKEAIDRRDSGGRDPAFYAAKALESTIKIISAEKGWTHGGERGAHSYIDNLASAKNGSFISKWEQSALKLIFSDVRNELGHGPGNEPMPELSSHQTSWTIESCMSWIKCLINRL